MKDGAAQPKGNWTATVAETLLGRDCAVTWMRVHSGHWTVGLQGQSVFFSSPQMTGGHGRWSQQGEAQMVTSRCLPSPCSVVGAVLEAAQKGTERFCPHGTCRLGLCLKQWPHGDTEAGSCAIAWGLAIVEYFLSPLILSTST